MQARSQSVEPSVIRMDNPVYRRRRTFNQIMLVASLAALVFGLFWLFWIKRMDTSGWDKASFSTSSATWAPSVMGVFRNFFLAGVL